MIASNQACLRVICDVISSDMAITSSAKKANKQAQKRRVFNTRTQRAYKNAVKEYKNLVSDGKADEADKVAPKLFKAIDKAKKRGIIKKNTASRVKSRLTKRK